MSRSPRSIAGVQPCLVAAALGIGAGVGVIFPLLAELQDTYDFSTAGLGLISGVSFLAALASGLLLSGLADRGHTRVLLVGGLALSALTLFWFAVATELWQLVVARALEGVGAGVFFPAARRAVAAGRVTDAGARLGTLTAAETAGLLLGPAIGAALFGAFGLAAPFVVVGVVLVVVAVWVTLERLPAEATRAAPPREGARSFRALRVLRRPEVAAAALMAVAMFLPIGLYDALWSRYLTDRGAGTLFIGVGLSLYSLPVILLAPAGGRLADRIGSLRAATLAAAVVVPLTAVYGLASLPVVITAVAVVEGVAQAVAEPASQLVMLAACGHDDLAAGQGAANAAIQTGAATSALLSPIVYEAAGATVVFIGCAAVMALLFGAGRALYLHTGAPTRVQPGDVDAVLHH